MSVSPRSAAVTRKTAETDITLDFTVDGSGSSTLNSGVPFLDHMLTLFAVHGFFDLQLLAKGDTEIDDHHSVEDIGICLGEAINRALDKRSGIARYGSCYLPMDETLVRVVIDLSNRPFLHYNVPVREERLGNFDTGLALEFFRAVAQHGGMTLHIDLLHGSNGHHILEAVFKGFARALRMATAPSGGSGVLSSKGCL
jgi:imidazoleglycerol-phosphate dehydratase